MASYTLADFRVALDSSIIALAIFFQALGAFAAASFFMGIAHHFVSESPGVFGDDCGTSSLDGCFLGLRVEAIVACAAR